MTKMYRRALSILLAFALVFGSVPNMQAFGKEARSDVSIITSRVKGVFAPDRKITAGTTETVYGYASFSDATASDAWFDVSDEWASFSDAERENLIKVKASASDAVKIGEVTIYSTDPSENELGDACEYAGFFGIEVTVASNAEAGRYPITVTIGSKSASADIIVESINPDEPDEPDEPVLVENITIEGPDTVEVGESITLKATATPSNATNKKVIWTSSNPETATVDEITGVVKGIAASVNPVTITASSVDGNAYEEHSVTVVEKTVIPPEEVKVKEIIIEGEDRVKEGASIQLRATASPSNATNQKVKWFSDNEEAASVDQNGLVKGIKANLEPVTITAAAMDGSNVSNSVKVWVLEKDQEIKPAVPVESIQLNSESMTLYKGEMGSLDAVVAPEDATYDAVTWTSADPKIAAVDENGLVKAMAAGKTTVTAKAGDKEASCAVEVLPISIELSRTEKTLQEGTETTVSATIRGFGSETKWTSSDEKVAVIKEFTDKEAVIKAVAPGTAVITATVDDSNAKCKITVTAEPVVPTPADKLEDVLVDLQKAIESGDEAEINKAVDTAVDKAAEICSTDNMDDETVLVLKNLETMIINAKGWEETVVAADSDVPVEIQTVTGAALNIPTNLKNVKAALRAGLVDISTVTLPGNVNRDTAVALDLALDILSTVDGSNAGKITDLKVPVVITMEIPDQLVGVEKLVVYHYHGNDRTMITPTVDGKSLTFAVDRFSTFVLAEAPKSNGGGSGSGSSGGSVKATNGLSGQWIKDATGWWFKKYDNTYPANTWGLIDNKWYHFDAAGYMQTGWLFDGGRWYFLQPQGDMAVSTWVEYQGSWYYLHSDGCMLSGQWLQYKNQWYYLNNDGSMAKNTVTPDGYTVNADGIFVQ